MKTTIILGQNDDSFLGYDPDVIASVNVQQSKESYEKAVTSAINAVYPDFSVEFSWNENEYTGIDCSELQEKYPDEWESIRDDIIEIEMGVYDTQDFWVEFQFLIGRL